MPNCTLCHAEYEARKGNPLRRCPEHEFYVYEGGSGALGLKKVAEF